MPTRPWVITLALLITLSAICSSPRRRLLTTLLETPNKTEPALIPPISDNHRCKENAIVYLAQKKHSSYGRDSYSLLQKSLHLLYTNYLANNHDNTAVFIFHEGDFTHKDWEFLVLESTIPIIGNLHFVNLANTEFWEIPEWLRQDDPDKWQGSKRYRVGYRHMMRWYAVKIWDFFHLLNQQEGCEYKYIMRLDEESYLHSPIDYNLFDHMKNHDYVYGFRQCSYEMGPVQQVFKNFTKENPDIPIYRKSGGLCGFYNNFFIASLDFFRSPHVQQFLQWVDQQGVIYQKRVNDLVLQTAAVYAFAPPTKIHRFLDFTYEHFTMTRRGCPFWGGIQAGYADPNGWRTVYQWKEKYLSQPKVVEHCKLQGSDNLRGVRFDEIIDEKDLSPSYQHLPPRMKGNVQLQQIAAGFVDLPDKLLNSG